MKKFISVLLICLFCFGCSKEEKNITINIYENSDNINKEIVQNQAENSDIPVEDDSDNVLKTQDSMSIKYNSENTIKENILIEDNSNIAFEGVPNNNEVVENATLEKSKLEEVQDWYSENKDELKEISEEIHEEDKNTISSVIDSTSSWYQQNKDELSEINKEILSKDKETITDVIDSVSSWYNENKDELKVTSEEIYNNDKQTIEDLYNKFKNVE